MKLRLRVENELGYKTVKWIDRIEFIKSEKLLGKGEGGKNEDDEYFDLLPDGKPTARDWRSYFVGSSGLLLLIERGTRRRVPGSLQT